MKKSFLALCLFASQWALAKDPEVVEIVRSHAEVPLTLNLNTKTVRCLVGDYGASSLKISIPEIREYTVFPQTTRGETAPCINAGACEIIPGTGGLNPGMVLDPNKPTEDAVVTVTLYEVLALDHEARTCHRNLSERLSARVRGLDFQHADGADLGELDYKTCLQMKTKQK